MKRIVSLLLVVCLLAAGVGGYFLIELYRPFEPRTSPPKALVPQYDGPGALSKAESSDQP